MSLDAIAKRRRAALAVFTPVLNEDALMDTLWLLHDAMRGESAREVISAVDQVAQRHALDARTCKRLYESFFRALHQVPDDELPLDPWPAMVATRPGAPAAAGWARTESAFAPVPSPPPAVTSPLPASTWAPAAAAMAAVQSPAGPAATAGGDLPIEAVPASTGPAHVQVFAALMRAVLGDVRQRHPDGVDDLRACALAALGDVDLNSVSLGLLRQAWQAEVAANWHIDLSAKDLSRVVHLSYVALCEALGPVDADQVLTRAVKQAERVPAAREFSPKQLM